MMTTPLTSSFSNAKMNRQSSPSSSRQEHAKDLTTRQEMQSSPATHSTSSSCSSLSLDVSPKKSSVDETKAKVQEDKKSVVVQPSVEPPVAPSHKDNLAAKPVSGFLIGTPSSTGTSASSSSSSHKHFTYENIEPQKKVEPTASPFLWPSQFRRQLSLNPSSHVYQPIPSTPYTPPPMLSPFRRGPGLYYRVFSHPGPSLETQVSPTTPLLAFSPMAEESSGPKINVGEDYQASIPQLRTSPNYDDDRGLSLRRRRSRIINRFLFSHGR